MAVNHPVSLLRDTGTVSAVLVQEDVKYDGGVPVCTLNLHLEGSEYLASGSDFFEALIGIRKQLDSKDLRLQVYGASRNVWPSGMARSMGLGLKAYRMTKGKQAQKQDMVSIFATGADVESVSISDQEQFKNEWFASLG